MDGNFSTIPGPYLGTQFLIRDLKFNEPDALSDPPKAPPSVKRIVAKPVNIHPIKQSDRHVTQRKQKFQMIDNERPKSAGSSKSTLSSSSSKSSISSQPDENGISSKKNSVSTILRMKPVFDDVFSRKQIWHVKRLWKIIAKFKLEKRILTGLNRSNRAVNEPHLATVLDC